MRLPFLRSRGRSVGRQVIGAFVMVAMLASWPGAKSYAQQQGEAEQSHLAAIDAQRKALVEAMEAGPLLFRRALFVTEVPARFGEYTPRGERPFAPGEAMHIYIEPVGLVWARDGALWRFEAAVGLEIDTADGRPIASEDKFGSIAVKNQDRPTEVMTYLTLVVSDAPPGPYVIEVRFRDAHSGKTAAFRLPFTVGEAMSGPFRHYIAQ
jgi:hypothetical protein